MMRTLLFSILCMSISYVTLGQTTIAEQDFDGTATWTYTPSPAFGTFTSPDVWDIVTTLSPVTVGSGDFVGGEDVNNGNNPNGTFVELNFASVALDVLKLHTISFAYSAEGYDAGDNLTYQLTLDGVAQSIVPTVTGSNGNGGAIISGTEMISIPAGSASVSLKITITQNGSDAIGLDDFKLIEEVPLPVTLTAFNAKLTNQGAMLEWTTASEENNDYFSVEMSRDAARFSESAQIKGNGTTESFETYSYEYDNLTPGTYYFRLRQVDYDGQFAYSDVVSVTIEGGRDFVLFANTVHDYAQVEVKTPRPVRILNMTGATVAEYNLTEGINTLDVSSLTSGMYIISDGTTARRFVK